VRHSKLTNLVELGVNKTMPLGSDDPDEAAGIVIAFLFGAADKCHKRAGSIRCPLDYGYRNFPMI
jgi:hypothetical protein